MTRQKAFGRRPVATRGGAGSVRDRAEAAPGSLEEARLDTESYAQALRIGQEEDSGSRFPSILVAGLATIAAAALALPMLGVGVGTTDDGGSVASAGGPPPSAAELAEVAPAAGGEAERSLFEKIADALR